MTSVLIIHRGILLISKPLAFALLTDWNLFEMITVRTEEKSLSLRAISFSRRSLSTHHPKDRFCRAKCTASFTNRGWVEVDRIAYTEFIDG